MPRPRYRRNVSKRPRSFTQKTTVFCPRDHGLLPWRPQSLLLLMPIPGTGLCLRPCFGQGGSVSPTATDDRRHSWKSLVRARNRRSRPCGTFTQLYHKEKGNGRPCRFSRTLSGRGNGSFRSAEGWPICANSATNRRDSRAHEKKFSCRREKIPLGTGTERSQT